MGDIGHGLLRRPWQSTAGSGGTRVLATLWPTLGMLCLFFLPGGVSSVTFFTSACESDFFPNTCDVRRRLCCRPLLSVAQLGTTCVLAILWATPGTRNSLKLVLWGLLWATKCAPSEKRESDGAETIGGCRFFKSNNNQPKDGVCGGGLSGRARDGGGRCQGRGFSMFGAAI
jgi:hypothetical protein